MITEYRFQKFDWKYFYSDACKPITLDIPRTRGKYVSTHCFVDDNHTGDKTNRIPRIGILLFCNRAPIIWHSKRQNSVDMSTFGSEFTAMKNSVEIIVALR